MENQGVIVIIDDDQDDRMIVEEIVKDIGIQNRLIFLEDGSAALKFLKDIVAPVAFILSDINMPKLSGLELKNEINKDESLKEKCKPFFFMTTTRSKETYSQAMALGVDGCFIKQDSMEGMKNLIQDLIAKAGIGKSGSRN